MMIRELTTARAIRNTFAVLVDIDEPLAHDESICKSDDPRVSIRHNVLQDFWE